MNNIFEHIRHTQLRPYAQAHGLALHGDWTWCTCHVMHVFMPIKAFYKGYKTMH